jgi:hypothetical protein
MTELLNEEGLILFFFLCCPLVSWFGCSGDEHRGSGEGCDGVDMTIEHGNWNGYHFGASEMLRKYCRDAVVVSLLPMLPFGDHCCCTAAAGRQARPRRVFSRAIAAIFP